MTNFKDYKDSSNKLFKELNKSTKKLGLLKEDSNSTSDQKSTSDQSTDQVINRSSDQIDIIPLTQRQFDVLKYIYTNRPFKVHGDKGLGTILELGPSNVRNQLKSLVKKGYIYKPYAVNNGVERGTTCRIIERVCVPLLGETHIKNPSVSKPKYNRIDQVINRSSDQVIKSANSNSYLNTSSILSKELNGNPELSYWREKGLTVTKMQSWMEEFNFDESTMIRYLCYCCFEMVDLGHEQLKDIQNTFNWFYKIVKDNGAYHKPNSYKSFEEKLLEEEHQEVENQKKIAEERKRLYKEKKEAIRDTEFWSMMGDPESKMYKDCFTRLSNFAKKKQRTGGKVFETAMQKAYDDILDAVPNDK